MTTERTREAYAAVADRYIDMLGTMDVVDPVDREFIATAFEGIDGTILDAGCGPGHLSAFLHGLGHPVEGVDAVPAFVDHARATHPRIRFHTGTIEQLAHEDASFGGVLAWYSLIHLSPEEFDAALSELHRVLAPGGVLVLGLVPAADVTEFDHKVITATAWPLDVVAERLRDAGFSPKGWETRPAYGSQRAHLAVKAVRHKAAD